MQLEGYSELAKLTSGGMSTVYKARQDSLDRIVAVKFLSAELLWDEQSRAFFDQESLVIARLNHPNIIKVIDRGVSANNRPYFVMEYIQGRDLGSLLQKVRLKVNIKVQLILQICRGLAFAHKNGVVHRDIKPANILIDNQGHAYILDFGIAWLEASGQPTHEEVVGTPDFMSPEQYSDPAAVSPASDIYSLGALMYQLFSGALPSAHFDDLRSGLGNVPAPLAELIVQCLQTDPLQRPAAADEVSFRLLKLLNGAHILPHERAEATAAIGNSADKFKLLDVISRNRWGAVYLFEDNTRGNLIVVKKRFSTHAGLQHAKQLKALTHGNLIRILGTSKKSDTFIVVMEYLSGGSLQERLIRPFELQPFLRLATEICSGMKEAHAQGIVHGNLRPSNVLLTDKGHAKISDFGFSKHYSDNLKTDWYQPQSRLDASVQRDIYSVGAIFYHMLTGCTATVRYGQLVADKGFEVVDEAIQRLVKNMIEMQSIDRLESFDAVLQRLNEVKLRVLLKEKPVTVGSFPWRRLLAGLLLFNLAALTAAYFLSPGFAVLINDWIGRFFG